MLCRPAPSSADQLGVGPLPNWTHLPTFPALSLSDCPPEDAPGGILTATCALSAAFLRLGALVSRSGMSAMAALRTHFVTVTDRGRVKSSQTSTLAHCHGQRSHG